MSSKYDYWSAVGRQQQSTESRFRVLPGAGWRNDRWNRQNGHGYVHSSGQRTSGTGTYTPGWVDPRRPGVHDAYPPPQGPVQCTGPRSCGAWCCTSDTHCPRCGKYLVARAGGDPALHSGPQGAAGASAEAAAAKSGGGAADKNGKGKGKGEAGAGRAQVQNKQFNPPQNFDVPAAKKLLEDLLNFGYTAADNDTISQLHGDIEAAEKRAAAQALKGSLGQDAKRYSFALDKKFRQLHSWRERFSQKQAALSQLQDELAVLGAEGDSIQESIMGLEEKIRNLGAEEASNRVPSFDELAFASSLPASVKEACKEQLDQLQQIVGELREAAAAQAPDEQPFVEDLEEDGEAAGFGAAPAHSDRARVGHYRGAELPLVAPVVQPPLGVLAAGMDELASKYRAGTITKAERDGLRSQLAGLQSSLDLEARESGEEQAVGDSEVNILGGSWAEDSHLG